MRCSILFHLLVPGGKWHTWDGQPEAAHQALQCDLPQTTPAGVACSAIGCDQQRAGVAIAFAAHLVPPPADGLRRELRGVVIDAHAHPAFVATQVEHAVGDDLAELGIGEVVYVYPLGLAFALPLSPVVLVRTHELLLLRVHGDHRLSTLLESLDLGVDVFELRVVVGVSGAFQGLAVALQAVAGHVQQLRHSPCTDRVALQRQLARQMARALAGPAQGRLRIAPRQRSHQTRAHEPPGAAGQDGGRHRGLGAGGLHCQAQFDRCAAAPLRRCARA